MKHYKVLKTIGFMTLLLLTAFIPVACSPKPNWDRAELVIDPAIINLSLGSKESASTHLSAFLRSANGQELPVPNVNWESSAPSVATITSDGFVTAHSLGTAEITATHTRGAIREARVRIEVEAGFFEGLRNGVPHLFITTEAGAPIDSKDDYVRAFLQIDGKGIYEDYEGTLRIRGRGNSTWVQPKKPYRLNLDTAEPVFGLAPARNWILLANYLDVTLMGNAIAMQAGQLLEMPFTHNIIPVDVTVNGEFLGNYMFTEHKEVGENRIDLGDRGVYIELDTHDKSAKRHEFTSQEYGLPVIVKYPAIKDISPAEAVPFFSSIEDDFNTLEAAIAASNFPASGYHDLFDLESLAKYLVVFHLSANGEINWPKSVYMYRFGEGPFYMGPLWDFDWAWGYTSGTPQQFRAPHRPLFSGSREGTVFFQRLLEDPAVQTAFKNEWEAFRSGAFNDLLAYIEEYAALIADSYAADFTVWAPKEGDIVSGHKQRLRSADWEAEVQRIVRWMYDRADYIDSIVGNM